MKITTVMERVFFPEKCAVCKRTLKINEDFCLCCGADEARLSAGCCEFCGKEKDECSCHGKSGVLLPHITGVFRYDGLIQNKLLSFKFSGRKELYKYFGDCVSERVAIVYADADFDAVTFVPSSKEAFEERGYNPSQLIAKRVGKKLFLPHKELLIKSKETKKQHTLPAKERMTNIKGSISPGKKAEIKGKTILLCDDIKTTGATLKECCDVLINAGAKDVYCVTVAVASNNINFSTLDKES